MKKLFTLLVIMGYLQTNAQSERTPSNTNYHAAIGGGGKMFVHTVTPDNSQGGDGTILDHPMLNENPNARPVITHFYTNTDNDKITGVYYDTVIQKWLIYNEDGSLHIQGAQYMVYIPDANFSMVHTATSENSEDGTTSRIDHALLNENPNTTAIVSHVYKTERINKNIGFWNDNDGNRTIYFEDLEDMIIPSSYHVAIEGEPGIVAIRVTSDGENSSSGCLRLNHPLLNNRPNAMLVSNHMWYYYSMNKTLTLYYSPNAGRWNICNEDYSDIQEFHNYEVLIYDEFMETEDLTTETIIQAFPNPMPNSVQITSEYKLEKIQIFNTLGQLVLENIPNSSSKELDVSFLESGIYFAIIDTEKGGETIKLIKR